MFGLGRIVCCRDSPGACCVCARRGARGLGIGRHPPTARALAVAGSPRFTDTSPTRPPSALKRTEARVHHACTTAVTRVHRHHPPPQDGRTAYSLAGGAAAREAATAAIPPDEAICEGANARLPMQVCTGRDAGCVVGMRVRGGVRPHAEERSGGARGERRGGIGQLCEVAAHGLACCCCCCFIPLTSPGDGESSSTESSLDSSTASSNG